MTPKMALRLAAQHKVQKGYRAEKTKAEFERRIAMDVVYETARMRYVYADGTEIHPKDHRSEMNKQGQREPPWVRAREWEGSRY